MRFLGACSGVVMAAVGIPALSAAMHVATGYGLLAALLALPLIWLGCGVALCGACVLTARLLQPKLSPHRPLPMYSLEFARWWLVRASLPPAYSWLFGCKKGAVLDVAIRLQGFVLQLHCGSRRTVMVTDGTFRRPHCHGCELTIRGGMQVSRLVNVATFMFAEHLRGSIFLTWWYRAMVRPHLLPLFKTMAVHFVVMLDTATQKRCSEPCVWRSLPFGAVHVTELWWLNPAGGAHRQGVLHRLARRVRLRPDHHRGQRCRQRGLHHHVPLLQGRTRPLRRGARPQPGGAPPCMCTCPCTCLWVLRWSPPSVCMGTLHEVCKPRSKPCPRSLMQ